jgi:putative component of toxin-antitoxin plasmid stabilization module
MADTRDIIMYSVKANKKKVGSRIRTPIGTDTGASDTIELIVASGARPRFYLQKGNDILILLLSGKKKLFAIERRTPVPVPG